MTAQSSCTLVIFGSTGNLAQIKLLPALYQLERAGQLAPLTRIVGCGRRDWSDNDWRDEVRRTLTARFNHQLDSAALDQLLTRLHFINSDLHDPSGFTQLTTRFNTETTWPTNRIFYLAVAPDF